jgi:hypothetical protein
MKRCRSSNVKIVGDYDNIIFFYLILQFSEPSSSKRARIKHTEFTESSTEYENCEEDMISSDYPEFILENLEPYSSDNEEPDAKEELMEEIKSLKGLFNGLISISTTS